MKRLDWQPPPLAHEAVASELRKMILSGELALGERLRQERLAERLGVSRAPLREAFRLLQAEMLVTYEPNVGYRVASIRREDVEEIYLLRGICESEAIRLAVPRLSAADVEELESLMVRLHDPREPPERSLQDRVALHERFHFLLFERAESPRLLRYVQLFWRNAHLFRLAAYGEPQRWEEVREGHSALLDACRQRDPDAAVHAMAAHRADTLARVLAYTSAH